MDEWDEREIQWLESFLRCVKWMEDQGLRVDEEKTRTDGEMTASVSLIEKFRILLTQIYRLPKAVHGKLFLKP